MNLSPADFAHVVRHTPLISIDLIIRDADGRILLGLRTNRPAQHRWFVPGGRILKDERVNEAFRRITRMELGVEIRRQQATFLGVFDHLYPDNFSGENGFGTQYVVLGHELRLDLPTDTLPADQHRDYRWFTVDELLRDDDVHENTKLYFR